MKNLTDELPTKTIRCNSCDQKRPAQDVDLYGTCDSCNNRNEYEAANGF